MCSKENTRTLLNAKFNKNLDLVFCGKADEVIKVVEKDVLLKIAFKKHHSKVNINATYDFDSDFVNSLSNEQLSNLIKFFTLFETNYYNRHSATAIPYLLDLLNKRNFDGYEELVNWAIKTANSENPYIPFGTLKYAACKNLSEYKRLVT